MAITTDYYINNILPDQSFAQYNLSVLGKIHFWIYHHPPVEKIIKLIAFLGVFSALVYFPASLLIAGYTITPIVMVLAGILILKAMATAFKILDLFALSAHDMRHHAFKEGATEHARLYYDVDIPVFEFKDNITPKEAGYAHGFLLGDVIQKIREKDDFAKRYVDYIPSHKRVLKLLEKIKNTLPIEYLEELQGLVEGFNTWTKSCWIEPKPIALDEILLFQLHPDSIHLDFEEAESKIACTAIISKGSNGEPIFARNLDWFSLGLYGIYSLVFHRIHSQPGLQSTYEVGLPGLVGTLTGMNAAGLSLAMNTCYGQTEDVEGMPAAFYNRYCLEHCSTVKEVDTYAASHLPLGAYHLTVADTKEATAFHMYQGSNKKPFKRHLKDQPLIVANCQYLESNDSFIPLRPLQACMERHQILNQYFKDVSEKIATQNRDMQKIMEQSLALLCVNNPLTIHRIVMLPSQGIMKVAFNNAYAGNKPLHTIQTR